MSQRRSQQGQFERRYQAFISSTFNDLVSERRQVIQALLELGCMPAGMEMFPASDDRQLELIKRVIDDCDFFILIIANRYGDIHPAKGLSYTEIEYIYADEHGKRIFVFPFATDAAGRTDIEDEPPEKRQALAAFRAKIGSRRLYHQWSTAADLAKHVVAAIAPEMRKGEAEGWIRARYATDPVTAHRLESAVERFSTDLHAIESRVVAVDSKLDRLMTHDLSRQTMTNAMRRYMQMQDLQLQLHKSNPAFAQFGNEMLRAPIESLDLLANGRLEVPVYLIAPTQDNIMRAFTQRFDAVTNEDLDFWQSTEQYADGYRKANYAAARRMVVTRIFLFSTATLTTEMERIAAVLSEQMRCGIGWAVAAIEDVHYAALNAA